MSRKTVLQILHSLNVGGAEILAAGLARELQDQFNFVFVCLDELGELGKTLNEEGFRVEVLNRKEGFDRVCSRKLKRLYHDIGASVLHAHQYTPFFYSLAAGLFGKRPPVLFTEHGRFHPDLPSRKRFIYNNILLRKKDRVIAVGESVRQALINNEGISATRIEVIYNGIDLARFENTSKKNASDDIRENLNIDSNDFVITLVGRLDYLKDHLTAVRTAECLMKSDFDFKMLFVGEGVERDKIEHEIRQRQLEGYVKLLGTRHDIPQILKASNVCFLSSISEGIPLTLIEGMAAGLPVVATNVGGIPEVVIDDETGCLADSGDEKCLASHLLRVAQDDKLCRTLGQAGQTRAQEMFSVKEMHLKYQRLYDEMATR